MTNEQYDEMHTCKPLIFDIQELSKVLYFCLDTELERIVDKAGGYLLAVHRDKLNSIVSEQAIADYLYSRTRTRKKSDRHTAINQVIKYKPIFSKESEFLTRLGDTFINEEMSACSTENAERRAKELTAVIEQLFDGVEQDASKAGD